MMLLVACVSPPFNGGRGLKWGILPELFRTNLLAFKGGDCIRPILGAVFLRSARLPASTVARHRRQSPVLKVLVLARHQQALENARPG